MHVRAVQGAGWVAVATWLAVAAPARADDNDLVLSRLATCADAGGADITCGDDTARVIGDPVAYRSLASELGVVFAPRLVEPADTLGFGGFQFSADVAFTSISNGAGFWDAAEGAGTASDRAVLTTIGFHVRKGIWLPAPSFEIGAGAVHLLDSRMWAAQGYAKLALHEGYHGYWVPSVALRLAGSQVLGADGLGLSVLSVDTTVSKAFGIAGTFNAAPYLGANRLVISASSRELDKTPNVSSQAEAMDDVHQFRFRDQDNIHRNRVFGGVKLQYYVFQLNLEASFALAGSSVDDRDDASERCGDDGMTDVCDAVDGAELQSTYTVSVGLDF